MFHNEAKLFAGCLLTVGTLVSNGIWSGRTVATQPSSRHWSILEQSAVGGRQRQNDTNMPPLAIAAPLPIEGTFEFEFKDLPWDKVLERYSSISRLAFAGNYIPGGTATFIPPKGKRQYTVREITDIINEMLLSRPASKYHVEAIDGKIPEKALQLRKRLGLVVPKYAASIGPTLKDHLEYIQDRYSGDRGDNVNVNLSFTIHDKAFTDAEQKAIWEADFAKSNWELTDVKLDT